MKMGLLFFSIFLTLLSTADTGIITRPKGDVVKQRYENVVADIAFILDASQSDTTVYEAMKTFVLRFIKRYKISDVGTHGAVITCGNTATIRIPLNRFMYTQTFIDEVKTLKNERCKAFAMSLNLAQQDVFQPANGGRTDAKKVLIILTDGIEQESDKATAIKLSSNIRSQGVTILFIGVGEEVKPALLNKMGGGQNTTASALLVKTPNELKNRRFVHSMVHKSAELADLKSNPVCKTAQVDIGFILDASGSLKNRYQDEKNFLKKLSGNFENFGTGTHASVVSFSEKANLEIKFNQFKDSTAFDSAVDAIKFRGGRTRIDLALQVTKDEMFSAANGARPDVQKILVLITDGRQTAGYTDPIPIAKQIREMGITLLVIGIGTGKNISVQADELEALAGGKHWYTAKTFDELLSQRYIEKIQRASCEIATDRTKCREAKKLDICFLIDSSGSIISYYFAQIKEFVSRLATRFDISQEGVHASAIVFSDYEPHTKVTILLNDYFTSAAFRSAIKNTPHIKRRTRIDLAFTLATNTVFQVSNGMRENATKIIILLTDGKQNPTIFDPVKASEPLYRLGAKIITVGITENVTEAQLEAISRNTDDVFYADTFDELDSVDFIDSITDAVCPEPIDRCKENNGGCEHICISEPFQCKCKPGFKLSADGKTCEVKDLCKINNGGCSHSCVKTAIGTINCKCPNGWTLGVDQKTCTCDDPCVTNNGGCDQTCTNNNGVAQCSCKTGYRLDTDGKTCKPSGNCYSGCSTCCSNCGGVKSCRNCCSGGEVLKDVYNIVFHPNSGPNYIFNGLKVTPSETGGLTVLHLLPSKEKLNAIGSTKAKTEELSKIVKQAYDNVEFRNLFEKLLAQTKGRKRRSVEDEDEEGLETFNKLGQFANLAGCNKFLNEIKKNDLMQNLTALMKEEHHVTLFCPIDKSYDSFDPSDVTTLLNHIAIKHDQYGMMYQTLSGGKIAFNPIGKDPQEVSWKANNAEVLFSFDDGINSEIIVTNDIIRPIKENLFDTLKKNDDVSIFYEMLSKSSLTDVFSLTDIEKICFTKDTCLPVSESMREHLRDALNFRQYTILVPTNAVFKKMNKQQFDAIMKDADAKKVFLQDHTFLGSLGSPNTINKEIVYSISPNHSVLTMNVNEKNVKMLTDANDRLFEVNKSIPVQEGLIHIVSNIE